MCLQNRNRLTGIENKVIIPKGKRGDLNQEFELADRYALCKIDKQQGPTV